MNSTIDLRSDTVTQPDAAMRAAMERAPLGDDVFGDDPSVQHLEAFAAEMCGREASLFTPSGTMANSIAIATLTRPGEEVILEALCHSFNFECAGASRLWGVQCRTLPGVRGQIPLDELRAAIRPSDIHLPRTGLVILEQTSNVAGGCVLPFEYLESVSSLCRERGLKFHIDGARIFNAAVASGRNVRDYAQLVDSLMFCVSKGLGAPCGSLLVGDADTIAEARRVRKLLGGGMRQAGLLAACGTYALENNVERLAEDHGRAVTLAEALSSVDGLRVDDPETNMVYFNWAGGTAEDYRAFAESLADRGVRVVPMFDRGLRAVFHKDVDADGSVRATEVLRGAAADWMATKSTP
ncbi:MAG: low-specificity L-threonine aldolase [Planctomycetota bacterium]